MEDTKKIVEINGVKLEIDMRYARTIENYKIGDGIKVLMKEYSSYSSYPGIVVGFDNFPSRPTMIIAYVKTGYNPDIHMAYFNSESKDIEIAPIVNEGELVLDKEGVLDNFERMINKAKNDIADVEMKRDYFLKNFRKYFADVPPKE